jgi:hypothetical protein
VDLQAVQERLVLLEVLEQQVPAGYQVKQGKQEQLDQRDSLGFRVRRAQLVHPDNQV